jgi:hypothetical protein
MAKFRDLAVGDTFDWISEGDTRMFNSFFKRCVKLSARTYTETEGEELHRYRVGSIGAAVFHVERKA